MCDLIQLFLFYFAIFRYFFYQTRKTNAFTRLDSLFFLSFLIPFLFCCKFRWGLVFFSFTQRKRRTTKYNMADVFRKTFDLFGSTQLYTDTPERRQVHIIWEKERTNAFQKSVWLARTAWLRVHVHTHWRHHSLFKPKRCLSFEYGLFDFAFSASWKIFVNVSDEEGYITAEENTINLHCARLSFECINFWNNRFIGMYFLLYWQMWHLI